MVVLQTTPVVMKTPEPELQAQQLHLDSAGFSNTNQLCALLGQLDTAAAVLCKFCAAPSFPAAAGCCASPELVNDALVV
jgi:hypothetical protein